jgi:hypothetical protein
MELTPKIPAMKELILCLILLMAVCVIFGQGLPQSEIDPEIVGRWDYLKSVVDGKEVYALVGSEHYYADGKVIFINWHLKPYPLDRVPETSKELAKHHDHYFSGMGTYTTDKENNLLAIEMLAVNDTAYLGATAKVRYEIRGDTIIFMDQYYFTRAEQ